MATLAKFVLVILPPVNSSSPVPVGACRALELDGKVGFNETRYCRGDD
jgi:hypothetical protein